MRAGLPWLLIGCVVLGGIAATGCGGDDVGELQRRIDELEAENAKLKGLEDGEASDSLDGLDQADLELLESLPQEYAGEEPPEQELTGVDIWASPPPAAEITPPPPPGPTTPESHPIVLPAPPPREDEISPVEENPDPPLEPGIGGPGAELQELDVDPLPVPVVETVTEPPAPAVGGPRLAVPRAVLGPDVVAREPAGVATRFPRTVVKVYCFSEVSVIGTSGPTTLEHRWTLEGEDQGVTELRIGGDRWRTFSNRTVSEKPGLWQVELVDERGIVLETLSFTVE